MPSDLPSRSGLDRTEARASFLVRLRQTDLSQLRLNIWTLRQGNGVIAAFTSSATDSGVGTSVEEMAAHESGSERMLPAR